MKVLHIVPSYYPAFRYGGPIQSVHNLNKELVRQGVEVTVYTTCADGPKNLDVPLGVPVDLDGVKVYYFKPGILRAWFYSSGLHRMLARTAKDFDLIHVTSVFLFASALGAYYANKFNKPYIISPRGSLMAEPLARKSSMLKRFYINCVEKRGLRGAVIHFTAEAEKEEYLKSGLPLKDSFVIANGIDMAAFSTHPQGGTFKNKFGISEDKRIVLFLGRISWKKGFDTLIPAFKKVARINNSAVLVIAGGDGEGYKKSVQELISKFELEGKVIFTGELVGELKNASLRESDLFVLPSYSENFGMAVIEAMCLELPVIVTEGVAISKDIISTNAGVVIKKDADELAGAIVGLLENPDRAREMGRRGLRLVGDKYSIQNVAKEMMGAYNRTIKEYKK